jgi:hypothetical protein
MLFSDLVYIRWDWLRGRYPKKSPRDKSEIRSLGPHSGSWHASIEIHSVSQLVRYAVRNQIIEP